VNIGRREKRHNVLKDLWREVIEDILVCAEGRSVENGLKGILLHTGREVDGLFESGDLKRIRPEHFSHLFGLSKERHQYLDASLIVLCRNTTIVVPKVEKHVRTDRR